MRRVYLRLIEGALGLRQEIKTLKLEISIKNGFLDREEWEPNIQKQKIRVVSIVKLWSTKVINVPLLVIYGNMPCIF